MRTHINEDYRNNIESELWPITIFEVFLRKNFGRNHFSFSHVLKVFTGLFLFPILVFLIILILTGINGNYIFDVSLWNLIESGFLSWFIFSFVFLKRAISRKKEVPKSRETTIDRPSNYGGDFNNELINFIERRLKKKWTCRDMETFYEPMAILIPGIVLAICGEFVGYLFIVCAYRYQLIYKSAFKHGDDVIQRKADIAQFEKKENMIDGLIMDFYYQPTMREKPRRSRSVIIDLDDDDD